jgi:hypothetical protein
MFWGYTEPDDNRAKTEHYRRIQKLANQFKEIHGSIICRDLLGLVLNFNINHVISKERSD